MRPDIRGVLADSTLKKVEAVKDFIDKLKLSNVIAENHRVESEEFISGMVIRLILLLAGQLFRLLYFLDMRFHLLKRRHSYLQ